MTTNMALEGLYMACKRYNADYSRAAELAMKIGTETYLSTGQAALLIEQALHVKLSVESARELYETYGIYNFAEKLCLYRRVVEENERISFERLSTEGHKVYGGKQKSDKRKRSRTRKDTRGTNHNK